MMDPIWVGVDLGTQSVRVMAVADDGRILARAQHPLVSRRDGDRHEQDPESWWVAAHAGLSQVTTALGRAAADITAIAISGTSGTICLVDAAGSPVSAAIMYDDARGAPYLTRINQAGSALCSRLGYRVQSSWALPAIMWMLDNDAPTAGAFIAHQPDVVAARLAGRRVPSDSSHALKTGVDLDAMRWDGDVMHELGIDLGLLPEIVPSGTVIATVTAAASASTGLPVGCAIVAGMTDGCAAQLSAGATRVGSWNSVLGTTLVVKGVSAVRRGDPTGAVYSHRAPFGLGWLPGGASSSGAGALGRWLPGRDLDGLGRDDELGPVSYPLAGQGERFPFVTADAHAFFGDGAQPPERDAEAFGAIAYGIAAVERLSYDLLAHSGFDLSGQLSFTGGGSRNGWWSQLRCSVLGRTVFVPDESEGAVGMAMLASAALDDTTPASLRLDAAAGRMLGASTQLDPHPTPQLDDRYLAFVAQLEHRGWLDADVASFAKSSS